MIMAAIAALAIFGAADLPTVEITLDVSGTVDPFPHNWERTFGSGHALLATRADWQQQMQRSVNEIGLRGVRMHGVLDDDMSVTPDGKIYYWYNVDRVFDFLVSQNVVPIVELSFMPKALALNKDSCAWLAVEPGPSPQFFGRNWLPLIFVRCVSRRVRQPRRLQRPDLAASGLRAMA